MVLASGGLGSRAIATSPRLPRPYKVAAVVGEYGWAAWSFSRQAKLNAWSWHGLADASVFAWGSLGGSMYLRKDNDSFLHVLRPDVFLVEGEQNTESQKVEATTQWLDFGKAGVMKALTGIDFDGAGIVAVEVYVSVDGDRDGQLSESVPVGSNQSGWTYSGEIIPLSSTGTEFKLKFIADPDIEAQVNRLTLHFDELTG